MEREEEPADAAYRGFLFADLRGYTAFVERHGNAAAADLLDAYRSLVRDEVARHAGAEIRTEGDSFYVVFRSARRAAACGLAIVAAAEQLRRDQPERPIRVGIGINAGETVQRGEGFVGTAVNLAARVCAQAREGEVLVTAPVRDAVGSGAGLRFEPRGTRRLKGIARPVPLFSVRPASEPIGRSIPWLPVGMAAASLIVVAVAVSARMLGGASPSAEPSPVAGLHTDSPVPEATQATSATPSDAGAYPNAAEAELLSKLDESIRDDCARADDDDRPRFNLGEGIPAFGRAPREPIQIDAGLACEIASFGAPDLVQLWATRRTLDYDPADVPPALIANRAGSLGIPSGDCSTQNVGYDRWTLGDLGGWLLCRVDDGDAVIEWSYDDRPILGMALRRDGDLAALLRWWTAEARLLRP
jgi:class 3 adenylate cyclase